MHHHRAGAASQSTHIDQSTVDAGAAGAVRHEVEIAFRIGGRG